MLNTSDLPVDDIKYTILSLEQNVYVRATPKEFQTYDTAHDYATSLAPDKKPIICFARDAESLAKHLSKKLET
jgi:hypothetical protein